MVPQNLANARKHALRIFQDIIVPEAQHAHSFAPQESRPDLVSLDLDRVLPAIDLDHEPMRETDEIDDISAYGFLPPELESGKSSRAQHSPDNLLRIGHVTAKPAGGCNVLLCSHRAA
jgi:hypothetical protein